MNGPAATVRPCPHCGGTSTHPFASDGVCLRCAGERVLAGLDFSLPPPLELPADPDDRPAERIGPYSLIEEIGCGGMGRVYAARQEGLGRIVALKALPEGRGGIAGLEMRFLREAQTAARLRHPNIVTVHDSGRADGHVYFTMDYLEEGDLARRLREQPFTPRAAAALLEKVARALAYTHGEGVLHRDLKPSNILLDGHEPRLADFGLAGQLEPGGDLTAVSGVLGTPHYVAPEALRDGSGSLTEASDLYALGVILYEMLTGRTPFAGASPAQLLQLTEREQPLPLRLLAPAVPRDLETICLKCLEREPARRYPSARALAEDLDRFLNGEPVRAQPPGLWANFRRIARRHRTALLAAAAIVVVLTGATIISTSLAIRARRAEQQAETEAASARAISEFLRKDLLAQASPNQQPDRDLKLRTVLDRAALLVDGRFTSQPTVEAELRTTLAETYAALGERTPEKAQLERALALLTAIAGENDPRVLRLNSRLAVALANLGQNQAASALGRRTLALAEKTFGPESPQLIRFLLDLAAVTQLTGELADGETFAAHALALSRRVNGPDHNETRQAMIDLSSIYWSERKLALAEPLNVEAVAAQRRALGPEHPDTLMAMHNLASVYWAAGKFPEAEKLGLETLELRRRVLGPEHPETLRTQNNLATTYNDQARFPEAMSLLEKTVEVRRRQLGPEHQDTLSSTVNLAMVHSRANELEPAAALLAPALETARRTLGPDHPISHTVAFNLADLRMRQDRIDEAAELASQSFEARRRTLGADNAQTLSAAEGLAAIRTRQGRYEEAVTLLNGALDARLRTMPDHWRTHGARLKLGTALLKQGKLPEAETQLVEAAKALLAQADKLPASAKYLVTDAVNRTAELYVASNRPDQAAAWRERLPK